MIEEYLFEMRVLVFHLNLPLWYIDRRSPYGFPLRERTITACLKQRTDFVRLLALLHAPLRESIAEKIQ